MASGRCPVENFLDTISDKEVAKILWVLRLIRELERVPPRYFKKLRGSEEIWEARIDSGNNTFRLLGFFAGPHLVVLTSGFKKKMRKIPRSEIDLAEKRRRDFLRRKEDEG